MLCSQLCKQQKSSNINIYTKFPSIGFVTNLVKTVSYYAVYLLFID